MAEPISSEVNIEEWRRRIGNFCRGAWLCRFTVDQRSVGFDGLDMFGGKRMRHGGASEARHIAAATGRVRRHGVRRGPPGAEAKIAIGMVKGECTGLLQSGLCKHRRRDRGGQDRSRCQPFETGHRSSPRWWTIAVMRRSSTDQIGFDAGYSRASGPARSRFSDEHFAARGGPSSFRRHREIWGSRRTLGKRRDKANRRPRESRNDERISTPTRASGLKAGLAQIRSMAAQSALTDYEPFARTECDPIWARAMWLV
jgi:hypothetical protein